MPILVTGAAGFIGYHVCKALLKQGKEVLGIDNLNAYYDPTLKQGRLEELRQARTFTFLQRDLVEEPISDLRDFAPQSIVHLAAYAGVRYSLERPDLYLKTNLLGQLAILDLARSLPRSVPVVYASSSSVYGDTQSPFKEETLEYRPLSPYAVSKRSAEILSETYAHLYGLNLTGLRFFTAYGPWGRPDMAYFKFTQAIAEGKSITIFGDGTIQRDFTYIDDIVDGILAALAHNGTENTHRIYNLGNDHPVSIEELVLAIENSMGKRADRHYQSGLKGEAPVTWADIGRARKELGFAPKTTLQEGIVHFTRWYEAYRKLC